MPEGEELTEAPKSNKKLGGCKVATRNTQKANIQKQQRQRTAQGQLEGKERKAEAEGQKGKRWDADPDLVKSWRMIGT